MQDHRLVAHDLPAVDVAGRLMDIRSRANHLAGVEQLAAPGEVTDEDVTEARQRAKRRSGLLLSDAQVLEAMEHGQETKFLPVVFRKGVPAGDALATAEQLGQLARHLDETLQELCAQLKAGSIAADPYYRSGQENACLWCEYYEACFFDEERDKRRYLAKLKPGTVWEKLREKEDNHGEA